MKAEGRGRSALGRRLLLTGPQVAVVAVGRRRGRSTLGWRWPKTPRPRPWHCCTEVGVQPAFNWVEACALG